MVQKKPRTLSLDRQIEEKYLRIYCAHLNTQEDRFTIDMINPALIKLPPKQSPPDAILLDKKTNQKEFIELTLIGRSQGDFSLQGNISKHPEKFKNQPFIDPPPPPVAPLQDVFLIKLSEKCLKDYSFAAQSLDLPKQGTLLILFQNLDPFHDEKERADLLDLVCDRRVLESNGLFNSSFRKVVFGSFLPPRWNFVFSDIWRKD